MLTKNRSDFIYTLEDDEKRCLASIEKVERNIRDRIVARIGRPNNSPNGRKDPSATSPENTSYYVKGK